MGGIYKCKARSPKGRACLLLVEVSGIMLKEQKLTEKELRGYRQWLSELDVESREEQEFGCLCQLPSGVEAGFDDEYHFPS